MFKKTNLKVLYVLSLVILLIYFPIFLYLDALPIELWDESRLAINAVEMYHNGEYLIPSYMGEPDMWNTKPPLMIWLQVFFLHIFDSEVLAIRMPSALAAFFTILFLFFFTYKYLKDLTFSFVAAMVLVCAQGYIAIHTARTGDYDILLVFFLTIYSVALFTYLHTKKVKFLYLFFSVIPLAVLTKSVAGFFLLPGCFIYLLTQKELIPILKNKHTYIGLLIMLAPIIGYYGIREVYNPGYWNIVLENEWGGRYNAQVEGNVSTFWYYWQNLINYRFNHFYMLVPLGILFGFLSKNKKIRKLNIFNLCMLIPIFIVLSYSNTRLEWYDAPFFPFLALTVSIFIYSVFEMIGSWSKKQNIIENRYNYLGIAFLFLLFINPYTFAVNQSYKPLRHKGHYTINGFYRMGFLFEKALDGKAQLDGFKLLHKGYNAHQEFYLIALKNKGQNIEEIEYKPIKKGYKIIIDQEIFDDSLQSYYQLDTLYKEHNLKIYHILGEK